MCIDDISKYLMLSFLTSNPISLNVQVSNVFIIINIIIIILILPIIICYLFLQNVKEDEVVYAGVVTRR